MRISFNLQYLCHTVGLTIEPNQPTSISPVSFLTQVPIDRQYAFKINLAYMKHAYPVHIKNTYLGKMFAILGTRTNIYFQNCLPTTTLKRVCVCVIGPTNHTTTFCESLFGGARKWLLLGGLGCGPCTIRRWLWELGICRGAYFFDVGVLFCADTCRTGRRRSFKLPYS